MSSTAEIKDRIKSIEQTKKVTDAMYLISSVKMRRARESIENASPYFSALKEQIGTLISYMPSTENGYFRTPPKDEGEHSRHGILIVTSDRGLAGDYNRNVIKTALDYIARHPRGKVFIVGSSGRHYFEEHRLAYERDIFIPAAFPTLAVARMICTELLLRYDKGELDEIDIIYTDGGQGRPGACRTACLLPLEKSRFCDPDRKRLADDDHREFLPDPESVLCGIVPSYLVGFIYSSLADGYCAEQSARMSAMKTAGENAEETQKKLKNKYNSLRRAAITAEMTEITAAVRAKHLRATGERKDQETTESKAKQGV